MLLLTTGLTINYKLKLMDTVLGLPALKLLDFSVTRKDDRCYSFVIKGYENPDTFGEHVILEDVDPLAVMYSFMLGAFSTAYLDLEIKERISAAVQVVKSQSEKDYDEKLDEFERSVGSTWVSSPYTWTRMAELYRSQQEGTLEEYLIIELATPQRLTQASESTIRCLKLKYSLLLLHHEEMIENFKKYGELFYGVLCPPEKICDK